MTHPNENLPVPLKPIPVKVRRVEPESFLRWDAEVEISEPIVWNIPPEVARAWRARKEGGR